MFGPNGGIINAHARAKGGLSNCSHDKTDDAANTLRTTTESLQDQRSQETSVANQATTDHTHRREEPKTRG